MAEAAGPRLAVVTHAHPSISRGGSEIAAYTLYRGLLALGLPAIHVTVTPEENEARLELATPGEHVLLVPAGRQDAFYNAGTPGLAMDLAALLRREGVGRISFHHYLHLGLAGLRLAAALPGVTSLLTLHEYAAICLRDGQMVTRPQHALCYGASPSACATCFPEHDLSQFALRRDRFLNAFAGLGGFVAPSRFLAARYAEWGLDPRRITVIENGLPRLAAPLPPRHRGQGRWVFGYFGQLNPYKGIDTLLAAAELIAARRELAARLAIRLHGTIIGQPEGFREALEAAARRHPFLSFAGPYPNEAVRPLMGECDYVLVPSRWWENSPVVIQEAFAAGRPVICSDIGGMAEKVEDGVSGLHARVGDPAELVAAMERAMDPDLAARLSAGLPRPCDGEEMARRYLAAFAALSQPARLALAS
ncbi:glycosyltransferase [Siccirubricoccus sp. KC 17139]|uniref:Glycosyltransferase n=1 Tax=Siccirubricoccus soli TaxID=2899147 RepID=A0ABT1DDD6_9PROT|nr:glycosyltransferase [Siccirubricoccus soli]MCO6419947.1 glycosyltransferase [Siccirubricoccus soli]MCP2686082.1 glycosyltransferase [Siccirubricoccus soli]